MNEKHEIENVSNVLIVGKKRSGKTVEGFKIALAKAKHLKQPIYTYKHPNEALIAEMCGEHYLGNLTDILQLKRMRECIVIIDEAHIHFNTMEKKVNSHLRDILGLSTQCGVSIIFITHSFQFMNETLMACYIDVVLIKAMHDGHWETDRRYARKMYGDVFVQGCSEVFVHLVGSGVKRYVKSSLPDWWKNDYSHAFKSGVPTDLQELF